MLQAAYRVEGIVVEPGRFKERPDIPANAS